MKNRIAVSGEDGFMHTVCTCGDARHPTGAAIWDCPCGCVLVATWGANPKPVAYAKHRCNGCWRKTEQARQLPALAALAELWRVFAARSRYPHGTPGRHAAILKARGLIVQLRAFTMPLDALEAKASALIDSDRIGQQMIGHLYLQVAQQRRGTA